MRSIDEIKTQIEQLKRDHPSEPPAPFVPIPLSLHIRERVAPFKKIAVKYASLLMNSGELQPIDVGKLAGYREYGELLHRSLGTGSMAIGTGVLGIISSMDRVNEAIENERELDADDIASRIYTFIQIMNVSLDDTYDYSAQNWRDIMTEHHAEYKRLTSDDAFNAELDKVREEYKREVGE
ncbi:hypothetical protein ACTWQL_13800 [Pseudalkalibacillus sp. R45]|uniref:hypothetical protein n=1 Tax=Pseudalkalibacillus sp. R45 TaxID=3457433 RepID=UPI003FCD9B5D